MLTSNDRPTFPFRVKLHLPKGVDQMDVHLIIYDGLDQPVYQGEGETSLNLPPGLYIVRWNYAGMLGEQVVRLPQADHLNLFILRQTPAPAPGAMDTHEYYSDMNQTVELDEKTGQPLGIFNELTSRLHLLIRAHRRESYHNENLAEGLRLLDEDLQPLFNLRDRSRLDTLNGSLLCSLPAEPGCYFLEYQGNPTAGGNPNKSPRLFPLHLFANWQTRLFLFYEDEQPNFSNASLSILRLNYRHDDDSAREQRYRVDAASDMALNGLQNNRVELPTEIEHSLLWGKFENPLLGLLGMHYLLRHPNASQSDPDQEDRWRNTAQQVFYNLDGLVFGSPDVLALRFKAALRYSGDPRFPSPVTPVNQPLLLRASLEALLEVNNKEVTTLQDDSPPERLSSNLYYDSPWATFRPPTLIANDLEGWGDGSSKDIAFGLDDRAADRQSDSWLEESVKEALGFTRRTGRDPDWSRLATNLGVSYQKMDRIVQRVKG